MVDSYSITGSLIEKARATTIFACESLSECRSTSRAA